MKPILPDREAMQRNGWNYQVQWIEDGKPCFVRLKTYDPALQWLAKMGKYGAVIYNLSELMRVH